SQDGAHSAVESRTCGCNLWLRRTRRAVPLAPSVPPCGIARTSPGSTPTSPRFPNPTLPLKFLLVGAGLHPTCLDGLPSGYIFHGAIRTIDIYISILYALMHENYDSAFG